jgi:hypothetical protein
MLQCSSNLTCIVCCCPQSERQTPARGATMSQAASHTFGGSHKDLTVPTLKPTWDEFKVRHLPDRTLSFPSP